MFDTVGTHNDEEAGRRSLASLLITSLVLGAGTAFIIGYGAMTVVSAPSTPAEVDDKPFVMVDIHDSPETPMAPPPPPPPPAAAPVPEDPEDSKVQDQPDELDDRVKELEPVVPKPLRDTARPAGQQGGTDGGEEGGQLGGQLGGDPDGIPGGTSLATGIRMFHHTELDARHKPPPRYPAAAEGLGLGRQVCDVSVAIDAKGVPFRIRVTGCPEVFAEASRKSVRKWRWYPVKRDRKKIQAQTRLRIVFED